MYTQNTEIARVTSADHFPALTQAYRIGALDAQLGDLACPELYFRNPTQKQEYCQGYASVAGATLTTVQFLGGKH